ncbi:MAG: hypothetical protein DWH91_10005 [Planctomycetota bacterium]|nr:MAG: hypothetical protein DWH91_10005 [Planctomycetota bacterium]
MPGRRRKWRRRHAEVLRGIGRGQGSLSRVQADDVRFIFSKPRPESLYGSMSAVDDALPRSRQSSGIVHGPGDSLVRRTPEGNFQVPSAMALGTTIDPMPQNLSGKRLIR